MKHVSLIVTATVFCLMVIYSGYENPREAWAAVRHVSKRIKIVRPSAALKPSATLEKDVSEKKKAAPLPEKVVETDKHVAPKPAVETADAKQLKAEPLAGKSLAAKVSPDDSIPDTLEPDTLFKEDQPLYSRKGRIDPFAPFLNKSVPVVQNGAQDNVPRRVPKTALERLAIAQLKFTAILCIGDKNIAMVQDTSGKGYIVTVGTYIGKDGGRVTQIAREINFEKTVMVIERKIKNIFGKFETKKIELKLKKPGE